MNAATMTPEVREVLGRSSAASYSALTEGVRFLAALNAKAVRTGSPVFAGVPYAEKQDRRAAGRRAKAARKLQRTR